MTHPPISVHGVKRKLFVGETTSDSAMIPILEVAEKVARNLKKKKKGWFACADVEGVVARAVDGNTFHHENDKRERSG